MSMVILIELLFGWARFIIQVIIILLRQFIIYLIIFSISYVCVCLLFDLLYNDVYPYFETYRIESSVQALELLGVDGLIAVMLSLSIWLCVLSENFLCQFKFSKWIELLICLLLIMVLFIVPGILLYECIICISNDIELFEKNFVTLVSYNNFKIEVWRVWHWYELSVKFEFIVKEVYESFSNVLLGVFDDLPYNFQAMDVPCKSERDLYNTAMFDFFSDVTVRDKIIEGVNNPTDLRRAMHYAMCEYYDILYSFHHSVDKEIVIPLFDYFDFDGTRELEKVLGELLNMFFTASASFIEPILPRIFPRLHPSQKIEFTLLLFVECFRIIRALYPFYKYYFFGIIPYSRGCSEVIEAIEPFLDSPESE